ncbi:hypothetical protein JHW43_009398 [Diplocarpon mali]|nr:hypothetical protein JHW43_009398 [Diplocarpon mali]
MNVTEWHSVYEGQWQSTRPTTVWLESVGSRTRTGHKRRRTLAVHSFLVDSRGLPDHCSGIPRCKERSEEERTKTTSETESETANSAGRRTVARTFVSTGHTQARGIASGELVYQTGSRVDHVTRTWQRIANYQILGCDARNSYAGHPDGGKPDCLRGNGGARVPYALRENDVPCRLSRPENLPSPQHPTSESHAPGPIYTTRRDSPARAELGGYAADYPPVAAEYTVSGIADVMNLGNLDARHSLLAFVVQ